MTASKVEVLITSGEWYPVYYMTPMPAPWARTVEVDEATLLRWHEAFSVFGAVQKEMKAALEEAEATSRAREREGFQGESDKANG